jgi:aryl-alcohol dehydrogenase-like predicted oxidoreductase
MSMSHITTLDTYRLLGRSGLRVSPLSLGTMTFGTDWGWGADSDEARRLLETYMDRGGNFVDTASAYTDGTSEKILGEITEGRREQLVIATKYTMSRRAGDPNAGGNHRKSMVSSVESSLRSLGTDYIDLLYCTRGTRPLPWRKSCAPWTTWCGREKYSTSASPTPRPGRCHGCRRSPNCVAGRP